MARDKLNSGEENDLEELSDLVASYEDDHHAIGPAFTSSSISVFWQRIFTLENQSGQKNQRPSTSPGAEYLKHPVIDSCNLFLYWLARSTAEKDTPHQVLRKDRSANKA